MFSRAITENCSHPPDGICSKCVLNVAFNDTQSSVGCPNADPAFLSALLGDELKFMRELVNIGRRLRDLPTKEVQSQQLIFDLFSLNEKLPARIWLPIYMDHSPHVAPYCIYVEIMDVENISTAELPEKETDPLLIEKQDEAISDKGSTDSEGLEECPASSSTPTTELNASAEPKHNKEQLVQTSDAIQRLHMPQDPANMLEIDVASSSPPSPTELSLPDWFLMLSPKSQRRRRQQIEHSMEDPSASKMSEPWEEKEHRIRVASPYGHLPNWRMVAVIVKTGDDLHHEMLAYQFLQTLKSIWEEENVPLYLRPYRIFVCSHDSGLIEPIPNACSLHQIKRNLSANPRLDDAGKPYPLTLFSHFYISYGSRLTKKFIRAQQNFLRSCAAYCLACYFLQVKDRHNGNILLDHDGYLIHIDFGYILSMSPRNLGFETSPFKLTQELIEVMNGTRSDTYAEFKNLILRGLLAARKHHERLVKVVENMINHSQLACFRGGGQMILRLLRDRFHLDSDDADLPRLVDLMVEQSRDSLTTRLYDNFQYYTNGIF